MLIKRTDAISNHFGVIILLEHCLEHLITRSQKRRAVIINRHWYSRPLLPLVGREVYQKLCTFYTKSQMYNSVVHLAFQKAKCTTRTYIWFHHGYVTDVISFHDINLFFFTRVSLPLFKN